MKKTIAILMAAILALALCTTAFAATYTDRDRDLTFEYDDKLFEITMDDQSDDELLVILSGKEKTWGETSVSIHLADLDDGEKFPTMADFDDMVAATGDKVTQGEWNGFKDVFMYTSTFEDGTSESVFIVPIYDHDEPEVEDILTVKIGVTAMEDSMARDDAISAIVDTLKVLDD